MKNLPVTILAIVFGLILIACSNKKQEQTNKGSEKSHASHANMDMPVSEPTDESIYNLNSSWQNRYGHTIKIDSLRGKTQVLAMVYTHCEYACPRILADMKRIRDGLSKQVLHNTNFSIVSIDPERDTPGRLHQFAKENDLSDMNWTLLHGSNGSILELAALLGFKYKRISEKDFTHSNLITLLNKKGEIVYQRQKLTDSPSKAIDIIEKVTQQ
jgi:protein SCO1/2